MSIKTTRRICWRCGTLAGQDMRAEPICNDHGLVAGHSYVDLPTLEEARNLAATEYAWRRSEFNTSNVMCLSRGADGGLHVRKTVASMAAAEEWIGVRAEAYAQDIASGRVFGTLLFWNLGAKEWYLG